MKKIIFSIFISMCIICLAENDVPMGANAKVLAGKFKGDSFLAVGTLERMKQVNVLKLPDGKYGSLPSILKAIGLDQKECVNIEGISINGWSVQRYQASKEYDLYVEVLSDSDGEELHVISVFVAPHSKEEFGAKLFTGRRWSEIVFKM